MVRAIESAEGGQYDRFNIEASAKYKRIERDRI